MHDHSVRWATQAFQYFLETRVIDYSVPYNLTFPFVVKDFCDVVELKKIHGLLGVL